MRSSIMDLKVVVCFLVLVSLSSARLPIQGDNVSVSVVGGLTYRGQVEDVSDGLLSLNCTGISSEMPLLYAPRNLVGGSDLGYHPPSVEKIPPTDVGIGVGSIIQLIWY